MHAALLTGHGGYETLEYRTDVPVPKPKAGEVLIRVAAAAVRNVANTATAGARVLHGDVSMAGIIRSSRP